MNQDDETAVLFWAGVIAGVGLAFWATSLYVDAKKAKADLYRARARAIEAELAYLERVNQLAAGNAAAAA